MISTHVLDTSRGGAATGVSVVAELRIAGGWRRVGEGTTDASGRINPLVPGPIERGTYRVTFDTGAYHRGAAIEAPFFPEVQVTFDAAGDAHYHVPLLLSPFGYSTYRGT